MSSPLFDAVVGRNVLMDEFEKIEDRKDNSNLIGVWSPGDFEKMVTKNPSYIKSYIEMCSGFKDAIRLEFWDTENNVPGYPSINEEQAIEIVKFIDKHNGERFTIHCDAGQSRSAGISMAVECITKHDGDRYSFSLETPYVGRFKRYSPNYYVYDVIMNTYDKIKRGEIDIYDISGDDKFFKDKDESPIGSNPFMED